MDYTKHIEKIESNIKELFELVQNFSNTSYFGILDSSLYDSKIGRYSILYALPFAVVNGHDSYTEIILFDEYNKVVKKQFISGPPIDIFQNIYSKFNVVIDKEWPITGGAIGYFGYELLHHNNKLPSIGKEKKHRARIPLLSFGFYDMVILEDKLKNERYLISIDFKNDKFIKSNYSIKLNYFKKCVSKSLATNIYKERRFFNSLQNIKNIKYNKNSIKQIDKSSYYKKINLIKRNITAGNIFQACFTYQKELPFNTNPLLLYNILRKINPSPFAAYLDFPDFEVICCSPERFFKKDSNNILEARPIKGTRKRGTTPEEDRSMKLSLEKSLKDKAENIMIVDLLRNDIGKQALPGSVKVVDLLKIEEYANVYQLVTVIEGKGKIEDKEQSLEYLKALFPGGSMTGAPKHRALEILNNIEDDARGIYSGSIGYLGFNDTIDLNIVIRTVLIKNRKAYIGTGGGIVYDSTPKKELEESDIKVDIILKAITYVENLKRGFEK